MSYFFDGLLYLTFFVAMPLFIIELIHFPAWVKKIDITKNKKNKPLDRYLEKRFLLLEGRIALTVILCAAVSILSLLLGSFPKEIEEPGFLLFLPIMLMCVITGLAGVFLGQYFLNTARKNDIFKKTDHYRTIFVRTRSQYGMGVLIGFYLGLIVAFPLMHLLFMLNLI